MSETRQMIDTIHTAAKEYKATIKKLQVGIKEVNEIRRKQTGQPHPPE